MSKLKKLLSIAGNSLIGNSTELLKPMSNSLEQQLHNMLRVKNGFYAFESALHVFPILSSEAEMGLFDWNKNDLWKDVYQQDLSSIIFFAEDIFGSQFCINGEEIQLFDPETGDFEFIANSMEQWADVILSEYEVLTGYKIAHEWQIENGSILSNHRLMPKIPFVLGGEFSLDNIYLSNSTEGMRYRANIANQIQNLPDGAEVRLKIE